MCFSSEASLLAFTLSYTIAWYLFNRNKNYDRWNALFIMCFSIVQLAEAGLWKSLSNRKINEMLTVAILLILLSQPLVQSYMGYKSTENKFLGYSSILFLLLFVFFCFFSYFARPGDYHTTIGPNGHLVWNFKDGGIFPSTILVTLYLLGISIPLLFMKDNRGLPLLAVGIFTAIYSLANTQSREFGSYWCFSAVVYSLVALFV